MQTWTLTIKMEKNKVDNLTKKVVYLFKKYARENGFWEEYKKLSFPLNDKNNQKTFIQVVDENEPVTLIQNAKAFCSWPSHFTTKGLYWSLLSSNWAKICVKEKLYRNKRNCFFYIDTNIYLSREEKLELLGDYWNY